VEAAGDPGGGGAGNGSGFEFDLCLILNEEIAMGLDIRIPLGLMFLVTGGLMALYGLFTRGSAIYEKSLDMNINLIWGALMLVFGLVVYIMGRRPRRLVASRVEATERPLGSRGVH
jgi:hypothetical protein